jgi:hypothetical protein
MSLPNQKPDLEDSINVTEAHGRVAREAAACARENRIAENGSEPISLWLLAACGVVPADRRRHPRRCRKNCFPTDATFREGYVRTPPRARGLRPAQGGPRRLHDPRRKIYSVKCNGCHMSDAKGDGANFPSWSAPNGSPAIPSASP